MLILNLLFCNMLIFSTLRNNTTTKINWKQGNCLNKTFSSQKFKRSCNSLLHNFNFFALFCYQRFAGLGPQSLFNFKSNFWLFNCSSNNLMEFHLSNMKISFYNKEIHIKYVWENWCCFFVAKEFLFDLMLM